MDVGALEDRAGEVLRIQKQMAALEKDLARARNSLERWTERLNWHFAEPDKSLYTEKFLVGEVKKLRRKSGPWKRNCS